MALTEQNPATLAGNGVQIWGEKPRRHPGADGVADATDPKIDAAYDDGLPDAAPANISGLHGPSYVNQSGPSVVFTSEDEGSGTESLSARTSTTSTTSTATTNSTARSDA